MLDAGSDSDRLLGKHGLRAVQLRAREYAAESMSAVAWPGDLQLCSSPTASRAPGSGSPSTPAPGGSRVHRGRRDRARHWPLRARATGQRPGSFPADDPANGGPTTGPRWQPASIITAQLQDGTFVNPPPLRAYDARPTARLDRNRLACWPGVEAHTHAPERLAGRVDALIRTAATASATRTSPRGPASPSLLQVATTFTAAYAHYLDASLAAAALPDASAQVRAQPGQLMPARARRGPLAVQSVAPVPGGPTFIAQLADRAHRFTVQLTVAAVSGRGLVVGARASGLRAAWSGRRRDRSASPPDRPRRRRPRAGSYTAICRGCTGRGRSRRTLTPPARCWRALKAHPPDIPPSDAGASPAPGRAWDAAPGRRLAGAGERHRRPRDLRADPHPHTTARPMARQHRRRAVMVTRTTP